MKVRLPLNVVYLVLFGGLVALTQCTPKAVEETVEPEKPPVVVKPDEKLSPCKKFSDNPNAGDLEDKYIIYRDFLKVGQYKESFDMWKEVYEKAPAADGRRWTVFSDGVYYYEYFISQESDPTKRKEYIASVLELYEKIGECYPEQKAYAKANKAFDLYYKYPDQVDEDTKYRLFKEVIDERGMDAYVFVLNPFTKLMADRFIGGKIDTVEARKYAELVPEIVDGGMKKGKDLKSWVTVRDYAIPYLERLEAVKGFYDCDYFKGKYYAKFQNETKNCDDVTEIYSKLRYGGCAKTDPALIEIYDWLKNNDCIATPASTDPCAGVVSRAYDALREGRYQEAVNGFEEAIGCSNIDKNKGSYNMLISKIYYAHLKNYPKSRQYARKAMQLRPDWGEPYLLVGKLYASSGPLCGPGRGFDSQVVTWPAIDKWQKAKSVDPSLKAQADELIRKYWQYMPSKEDIFQRGIQEGSTFKVGCWIQENTKVRTP